MRKFIIAAALAATLAPALPAVAQPGRDYRDDDRGDRRGPDRRADDGRQNRGDDRRGGTQGRGQGQRADWRQGRNYDYNRPGPGGTYYADRYYRDGSNYQPRRLSSNDRIYRGQNGRYYCRRNDGTTGLLIGALAGGALGNTLANGRSQTLGTLLGAGGGALLGRGIDRNNVRCR